MRVLVLVSIVLLALALGYEIKSAGYSAAGLLEALQALPPLQKLGWGVIIVAPLVLLGATFWEGAGHDQQRKTAAILETRLRGVRKTVNELDDAQKYSDHAAAYLERSDPEEAVSSLQRRLIEADRTSHLQQSRNETEGLLARVEQVRQQQQSLRERLGATIEKRRLIEPLFTELQNAQDDLDRKFDSLKSDDLHDRLQAFTQAAERMKARCGEVEQSMAAFARLKDEFDALQSRIAPLDNRQTGVRSVIDSLADVRDHLNLTIERLAHDGEASLADRTTELTATKKALEGRVSSLLEQFSTLDQANKEIRALFAKLRGEVDAKLLAYDLRPKV
jgi:chromosome segregation ATPase